MIAVAQLAARVDENCLNSDFGCRWINNALYFTDLIGRKTAALGMFTDQLFVWRDINAEKFVVCHITFDPLNLRSKPAKHVA